MSQHTRTQTESQGTHTSDADLRVQLEGRVEVLEAARARLAALESALSGGRWKRKLRAKPTLVAEWLQETERVAEAVGRTTRRAEAEGWSDSSPLMMTVREVLARRQQLKLLVRERLGAMVSLSGPVELDEELRRLDALVRKPVSRSPESGEVVLYQTDKMLKATTPRALAAWVVGLLGGFGAVFGILLATLGQGPWTAGVPTALLVASVLGVLAKSGRVWLTSERLLWVPTFGEAVSVPLESIPAGGVAVESALTLRVEGERRVRVPFLSDANQLATLIEMHSQSPLRSRARSGGKLPNVVVFPAQLQGASERFQGWAVLWRSGVVFFEAAEFTGDRLLSAVLGRETVLNPEAGWVLEQLRWFSEGEFDTWMVKMAVATHATRFSSLSVGNHSASWDGPFLRFKKQQWVLSGKVEWSSIADAERILTLWPE
ncbi:hypothetical protein MYSTI_06982 [Myxococcus stipitatus DSM 14675]|uniref:Uncharacterized protein n=1 Tax=Myxococcus stipitatus (strain DSM 14675 / JCM 12634 / Mx s8) TaxID=1278073 RepID=L7UP20_MYXSD|nr:hypothetical protein [Myxococcus stipitatus]AGC48254.1 hypothetical protein MYSTI_06982 [Myxococcus stipitatus DSM 14675]